jgi:hypothetical protein
LQVIKCRIESLAESGGGFLQVDEIAIDATPFVSVLEEAQGRIGNPVHRTRTQEHDFIDHFFDFIGSEMLRAFRRVVVF